MGKSLWVILGNREFESVLSTPVDEFLIECSEIQSGTSAVVQGIREIETLVEPVQHLHDRGAVVHAYGWEAQEGPQGGGDFRGGECINRAENPFGFEKHALGEMDAMGFKKETGAFCLGRGVIDQKADDHIAIDGDYFHESRSDRAMPLFISKTVTPWRLGFSMPATSSTERGSDAGSKEAELANVRKISA